MLHKEFNKDDVTKSLSWEKMTWVLLLVDVHVLFILKIFYAARRGTDVFCANKRSDSGEELITYI